MNSYEHTVIAKQDLSEKDNESLIKKYEDIINQNLGKVLKTELWGLRTFSQNIKNNKVSHIVHTSVGSLNDVSMKKNYQLLFANISSKVIIDILPKISKHLNSGGKAILSGIMFDRNNALERHIKDAGFVILENIVSEEWVCFSVAKHSQRN